MMNNQEIEDKLNKIVEEEIFDKTLFLVEINVKGESSRNIEILMDGDSGITIDQCAKMSRKVANRVEENEWIDTPYTIVVSSPGVGSPLKNIRQYKSNIGRKIKLQLNDKTEKTGSLVNVTGSKVVLREEKSKNPKKEDHKEEEVEISQIKSSKILVSF